MYNMGIQNEITFQYSYWKSSFFLYLVHIVEQAARLISGLLKYSLPSLYKIKIEKRNVFLTNGENRVNGTKRQTT